MQSIRNEISVSKQVSEVDLADDGPISKKSSPAYVGVCKPLQLLEIEAVELFGLEQAKVLFTVRGRLNSAPVDSLSANYDIRPPCDCRTDSMFACTGCRLKGQNCYWMNRGCGFMDAYSCNGKCPIQ